jgi:hypothetical protein
MNEVAELPPPISYPLIEHDGHYIVDTGTHRWLLDTGSPVSVGTGNIRLGTTGVRLRDNFMGLTIEWLQEMVGTHFDALVGMDALRCKRFMIDVANEQVHFGIWRHQITGLQHNFYTEMGLPVLDIKMDGDYCPMVFDTGAKISYLPEHMLEYQEQLEDIDDFYPGLGRFKAEVYETELDLGEGDCVTEAAVLPEQLSTLLDLLGVLGILGNNTWNYGNVYCSGFEKKIIFEAQLKKALA